jgi:hypothetical protein
MTDDTPQTEYMARLKEMVTEAERHNEAGANDRIRAREYLDGVMRDLPNDAGRSKVVQRVVREHAQKILPAIIRTLLGNEDIVEFLPEQPEDVDQSRQKTDYVNQVVLPESGGFTAIESSIEDALIIRNGILRACYEEKIDIEATRHSGLTEEEATALVQEPDTEVLETEEHEDGTISLFIKRKTMAGRHLIESVPRDEFLIDPRARSIEDATLVGIKKRLRRSDLVAMGYERRRVAAVGLEDGETISMETERQTRQMDYVYDEASRAAENQEIIYYDLYVRLDKDDDGIAELRHVCFAGNITEEGQLLDEYSSEAPFADLRVKSVPNSFEGVSLVDDLEEIQRIQSFLLRETFDNVKWQNEQMLVYQEGAVENPGDLFTPEFGKVIRVNPGMAATDAVGFLNVPNITPNTLELMAYFKGEAQNRTGITDASGGLPPDALQNMTATATALIERQGVSQADNMVRQLSWGLRRLFLILLRQIIRHQDKPRTVRLRNEWVQVDPRSWNASMDCSVNTGLGTGTRERDVTAMMAVLQVQERIVATLGEDNPFVTPEHLANTFQRFAQASGIKQPRLHFGDPGRDEIMQWMQKRAQRPDPEMMKVNAQIEAQKQLKTLELQAAQQEAAMKAEVDKHKEIVQSQAAVQERQLVAQIEEQGKDKDRQVDVYKIDTDKQLRLLELRLQDLNREDSLVDKDHSQKMDVAKFQHEKESSEKDRNERMAANDLVDDGSGKPESASMAMLKQLVEQMSKPKRVRTPDGEEFTMESV